MLSMIHDSSKDGMRRMDIEEVDEEEEDPYLDLYGRLHEELVESPYW